jgi:hypothetical protein
LSSDWRPHLKLVTPPERDSRGRYNCPDGVKRRSVTTWLKIIDKSNALVPWASERERELVIGRAGAVADAWVGQVTGAKFISELRAAMPLAHASDREMRKAGDIGTSIHWYMEREMRARLCLPEPALPDEGLKPEALEPARRGLVYLDEIDFEPIDVETFVYSVEHNFAGRTDVYGRATLPGSGRRIVGVGDYKSGKDIYIEAIAQCAAYRRAAIEMGLVDEEAWGFIHRMPKVDEPPHVVWFTPEEMDVAFEVFRQAQALYDGRLTLNRLLAAKARERKKEAA